MSDGLTGPADTGRKQQTLIEAARTPGGTLLALQAFTPLVLAGALLTGPCVVAQGKTRNLV